MYSIYFFVIQPLVDRYRNCSSQELPSHSFTDSAISKTFSLGQRIGNRLASISLPWSRHDTSEDVNGRPRRGSNASEEFLDEEVDNMAGFDIRDVSRRREELHRQVLGMAGATRYAQNRSMDAGGGV